MLIIGLTGLARCGKDEAANHLVRKYGFRKFIFSDIIIDELKKRHMNTKKDDQSLLGLKLRKEHGMDIMAKMLYKKIKGLDKVVISGFRSPEEVGYLKNKAKKFYLVKIKASPEIRFSRRSRADKQTKTGFFARDKRELKDRGFDKVLEMSDFEIENNSTLNDLCKEVDNLIKNIR